jgi:hypothetical protein
VSPSIVQANPNQEFDMLDPTVGTNPLCVWASFVDNGNTLVFGSDPSFTAAKTWDSGTLVFTRQATFFANPLVAADATGISLFTVAGGYGVRGILLSINFAQGDVFGTFAGVGYFGGGTGVFLQSEAATPPTANSTVAATLEYTEGGAKKVRGNGGTITTVAPA